MEPSAQQSCVVAFICLNSLANEILHTTEIQKNLYFVLHILESTPGHLIFAYSYPFYQKQVSLAKTLKIIINGTKFEVEHGKNIVSARTILS